MLPLMIFLGTVAGAWYLLIVRPQKDQQTQHGRLVERLQVGDHVLTVGGIYGRVTALEGTSVVLELAPGLTSRITTDGLARIVHGAEAALPEQQTETPREATDQHMHQHPDPQQAPQYATPQQPMQRQVPVHAVPTLQTPAPPAPGEQQATTFRAYVLPQIPTFEPRPWGGVDPVNHAPAPTHTPAPAPMPAPVLQAPVMQYQMPPQPIAPQPIAPQPMQHVPQPQPLPLHTPFSPPTFAAAPSQPMQHAPHPQLVEQPHAQHVEEPARRASRAPKGMGSSLRLDDPSLRDTMQRARSERAELADEYRKVSAPLVDVAETAPMPVQHVHQIQQAQPIGYDPSGVPLFAAQPGAVVQPVAHYPAPAHVPADPTLQMPRPTIAASADRLDGQGSAAFQRPTPYAPEHAQPHAHQFASA